MRRKKKLTHISDDGSARMVDTSGKETTLRQAVARARLIVSPQVLRQIKEGAVAKGDVLSTAKLAGVMAAKKTPELIPLCHPIPLDDADVSIEITKDGLDVTATARANARTGVEMEALTAAAVAALTIYDMCKSIDKAIVIEDVSLLSKSGGKSGDWQR